MTTDIEAGSGTAGDIAYVINQANANPNPAGRLIESSTPFFSTPQTITLTSTLELDEATGRNTIAGPGADLLTISGANTVGVFEVGNTTAAFMGLTISSGAGSYGAGVLNEGMRLVTSCTITNNSIGGNGEGGGIYNTGAITITDSTVANNSVGTNGHGGDIENHGNMTITDSTIASNSVGSGGQGGIYNGDDLTLELVHQRGHIDVREIDLTSLPDGEMRLLGTPRRAVSVENTDIGVAAKPDYLEGPWVEKVGAKYCLFYAANYTDKKSPDWVGYWTGVAYSDSPLGPWTKDSRGKVFLGGRLAAFDGPDGRKWVSYRDESGTPSRGRWSVSPVGTDPNGRIAVIAR